MNKIWNRPEWLTRQTLINRLEAGLSKKLTLISAPAGFGKSTLARQWLSHHQAKVVWISLSADDNQLDQFISHISRSIRAILPSSSAFGFDIDNASKSPNKEAILNRMRLKISQITAPLVLLFDDYEVIDNQDCHEVLQLLIDLPRNPQQQLYIVVLTRIDPPLNLSQRRVRGEINELRPLDLQFSLQETQQLINKTFTGGQALRASDIEILHLRTEGWAAGLQLCQILLKSNIQREQFLQQFSGSTRLIREYLIEQTWMQQSPDIQISLMASALLDRFNAAVCDAMLDQQNAESSHNIEYLERANLFLVSLDYESRWYRYHHLFRDFLRHQAQLQLGDTKIALLRCKAAKWLLSAGFYDKAFDLFSAAQDFEQAAEIIEQYFYRQIEDGSVRITLKRWLSALPVNFIQRRPGLLVRQAQYDYYISNFAAVPALLNLAETLLNDQSDNIPQNLHDVFQKDIAGLRLILAFWHGDYNLILKVSETFKSPYSNDPKFFNYEPLLYYANAKALFGDVVNARRILNEAIAQVPNKYSKAVRMLNCSHGSIYMYMAELDHMGQTGKQILALRSADTAEHVSECWGYYFQALACYERNQLQLAAEYLTQIEPYPYEANISVYIHALLIRALIAQLLQNEQDPAKTPNAESIGYLQKARNLANELASKSLLQKCQSFEIRLAWACNDAANAQQYLNTANLQVSEATSTYFLVNRLNELYGLIIQPDLAAFDKALEICTIAEQEFQTIQNCMQRLYYLAFASVILFRLGRVDEALKARDGALEIGHASKYIRVFVDMGQPMQQLLRDYPTSRHADYVNLLITAFDTSPPSVTSNKQNNNTDLLSDRELEILALLAKRFTRSEIANQLFISTNTVKTHISNIYSKLGVANYREAIAQAHKLHLL